MRTVRRSPGSRSKKSSPSATLFATRGAAFGHAMSLCRADRLGLGYFGVVAMLVLFYFLNILNVMALRKKKKAGEG